MIRFTVLIKEKKKQCDLLGFFVIDGKRQCWMRLWFALQPAGVSVGLTAALQQLGLYSKFVKQAVFVLNSQNN